METVSINGVIVCKVPQLEVMGEEARNNIAEHLEGVFDQKVLVMPDNWSLGVFDSEALREMQECIDNEDTEEAHHGADKVLCRVLVSLGQEQLVEMFNKVRKWYA